jgi:hypothetical protein
MRARRLIVRVVVAAAIVVAVLVVAVVVVLWTSWGRSYLRDLAEQQAESRLAADVRIGCLDGSLLYGATLHDLVLARGGQPIVSIDRVEVEYSVFDLFGGPIKFPLVSLDHPVVRINRIGGLLPEREPRNGGGASFAIERLVVNQGEVVIGGEPEQIDGFRVPDVIRRLQADLKLAVAPNRTVVDLKRLAFVGASPAVTVQEVSGTVRIADGDLALEDMSVRLAESFFKFSATIENFRALGGDDGED